MTFPSAFLTLATPPPYSGVARGGCVRHPGLGRYGRWGVVLPMGQCHTEHTRSVAAYHSAHTHIARAMVDLILRVNAPTSVTNPP